MRLEPGMEIVDLGCGTGATSLAAFRQQPGLLHAWAVDGVAEMLVKARDLLRGFPVTFVHEPAETFSRSVPSRRISRVLCNSAFFQFADPPAVLAEIRKTLKADGWFGLTVPGPSDDDCLEEIVAEVAALASGRGRPATAGKAAAVQRDRPPADKATPPTCDYRTVRRVLEEGGFDILSSELIAVEPTREEIVRWMLLPVFRPPRWRALDDREAALALAAALEGRPVPVISWNVVVAGLA